MSLFFLTRKIKSEFFLLNELLHNLTALHATPPKREPQTKLNVALCILCQIPNLASFILCQMPNFLWRGWFLGFFFSLFPFLFSASSYLICLSLVWKLSQMDVVFNYRTSYYAYL